MKLSLKKFFVITIITFGVSLPLTTQSSKADFNQNNLIDNIVFNNSGSMTASQIDAWLNTFPNSCISSNKGFTSPNPIGYNPSQGYLFGPNVTAGQVIASASQAYGLNPQVLLATLQKEQSLITGGAGCYYGTPPTLTPCPQPLYGNPNASCVTACQYAGGCVYIALGYDCPYYCDTDSLGFSKQVIKATWMLKFSQERSEGNVNWNVQKPGWDNSDDPPTNYSGNMTQGWHKRIYTQSTPTYFDGYANVNGTTIHMDNGATVALYRYTPFLNGGISFVNNFEQWFGSTYSNDTFISHPDGTLIEMNYAIFLIENNQRHHIRTPEIFTSYGYRWSDVKRATIGDKSLPEGYPIDKIRPGVLFRSSSSSVYTMAMEGSVWKKQLVTYSAFNSLGYRWDEVLVIPQSQLPALTHSNNVSASQHPSGSLVKLPNNPRVYLIDGGILRHIPNAEIFTSYRFPWNYVKNATSIDANLPLGSNVTFREGTVLFDGSNIFIIDLPTATSQVKRPIGPWECFNDKLSYQLTESIRLSPTNLPPNTGPIIFC